MLKTLLKTALATALAGTALTGLAAQELKVGVQNMAPWLDPGRDFSNVGSQFYFNAFDPLIGKDPSKAESVWQPGIATSWTQVSPTQIELKIRQSVTFHNGDPMTAETWSSPSTASSTRPSRPTPCASATRCPTWPRSKPWMPRRSGSPRRSPSRCLKPSSTCSRA